MDLKRIPLSDNHLAEIKLTGNKFDALTTPVFTRDPDFSHPHEGEGVIITIAGNDAISILLEPNGASRIPKSFRVLGRDVSLSLNGCQAGYDGHTLLIAAEEGVKVTVTRVDSHNRVDIKAEPVASK